MGKVRVTHGAVAHQVRDRLVGQGMNLLASSPEDLGRFLDPQMTRWAGVVREYGIRAGD